MFCLLLQLFKTTIENIQTNQTKYDIEHSKCIVYHCDENIDGILPIEYSKCIVYYSHQNTDSRLPMTINLLD